MCSTFNAAAPFVPEVLSYVDCHAIALGEHGWRALGPGSSFGTAITGLLTILIALLGYRMVLGDRLRLREGVMIVARIGIVLALATQWSAWSVLVFNVVIAGPQEIAGAILPESGLGGESRYGLAGRLQMVSVTLNAIAHPPPVAGQTGAPGPSAATNAGSPETHVANPAAMQLSTDGIKAIDAAESVLLVTGLGSLVAVRGIAGLLLALGPVFVGFLLFTATRGLFVAWASALFGVTLGAVVVSAMLALEMSVIEPQTVELQALATAGDPWSPLPLYIWASTAIFALLTLAATVMVVRVAAGLRLPNVLALIDDREEAPMPAPTFLAPFSSMTSGGASAVGRGRAEHIVDVVRASGRHDRVDNSAAAQEGRRIAFGDGARPATEHRSALAAAPVRLGDTARRSEPRQSGAASRRETSL